MTIESTTKEFNEIFKEIKELKNKIENEANKINILQEKTNSEIIKSYLRKHEILLKKENELKDKIQKDITKEKEQFEIIIQYKIKKLK